MKCDCGCLDFVSLCGEITSQFLSSRIEPQSHSWWSHVPAVPLTDTKILRVLGKPKGVPTASAPLSSSAELALKRSNLSHFFDAALPKFLPRAYSCGKHGVACVARCGMAVKKDAKRQDAWSYQKITKLNQLACYAALRRPTPPLGSVSAHYLLGADTCRTAHASSKLGRRPGWSRPARRDRVRLCKPSSSNWQLAW